jgi:hypothetical protein
MRRPKASVRHKFGPRQITSKKSQGSGIHLMCSLHLTDMALRRNCAEIIKPKREAI